MNPKKLDMDNKGNLTLDSRVIQARPIGRPLAILMHRPSSATYDTPSHLEIELIESHFLSNESKFPKDADAYLKSQQDWKHRTVGHTDNIEGRYFSSDCYLIAIQPYKIAKG